ncbi:MAG TPA: tetratricopeptide repeat protein, partial [Candidatus Hydrogenedentes bacterium]|nr:tetratricopeptide repeat protein [Candidatus Hydrogenedentota bacterium]
AWSLIPRYGLLGCGIGASDTAIQAAADPEKLAGTTLHSVPFKCLIEMGVAGLAAYLWFWAQAFRVVWRRLAASPDPETCRLGHAYLGVFLGCFLMLAVQPFALLSIFPFVFGLAFGPIAARDRAGEPIMRRRIVPAAATVLAGVVLPSMALYHVEAARVDRFADTLDAGPAAERSGDWPRACVAYEQAYAIAQSGHSTCFGNRTLADLPHFDILQQVAELDVLYSQIGITSEGVAPRTACLYGLGRVCHAQGRFDEAAERLEDALDLAPGFCEARFALAETYWAVGRFNDAVEAYSRAADCSPRAERTEARIAQLAEMQDPRARLEAARLLRQQGRWPEVVEIAQALVDIDSPPAQACFLLGVAEEIDGHPEAAREQYRHAAELVPTHYRAAQRLEALGSP